MFDINITNIFERYQNGIKDLFNEESAKIITIKRNNEPKKYMTSITRIETCIETIREEFEQMKNEYLEQKNNKCN